MNVKNLQSQLLLQEQKLEIEKLRKECWCQKLCFENRQERLEKVFEILLKDVPERRKRKEKVRCILQYLMSNQYDRKLLKQLLLRNSVDVFLILLKL